MRNAFHKFIDYIFKNSLLISGWVLIALTVVDISDINDIKIDIWGLKDFPIGKILYIIFLLIAFLAALFSVENTKSVTNLEKDNSEKAGKIIDLENNLSQVMRKTHELFNSYLTLLIKNLDFKHTERISVYKVFDNNFVLIARSSTNPNLIGPGRSNFPLTEGFIGKAWAEEEFFIDNLPDPVARSGYYNRVNGICAIPRPVVDGMKMLSRTYYINRIDGFDGQPKAIIVIESTIANAFQKDDVVKGLDEVKQPLVMFVEKNNGVPPTNQIGI
jgi:hypothetical protein